MQDLGSSDLLFRKGSWILRFSRECLGFRGGEGQGLGDFFGSSVFIQKMFGK